MYEAKNIHNLKKMLMSLASTWHIASSKFVLWYMMFVVADLFWQRIKKSDKVTGYQDMMHDPSAFIRHQI